MVSGPESPPPGAAAQVCGDHGMLELAALLRRMANMADPQRAVEARAGAQTWPPPIVSPTGKPVVPVAPSRLVVRGGLAVLTGCTRGRDDHPGCVAAPGGRWRCPSCGVVTIVAEPVAGPRLLACTCREVLCVHPLPAQAAPVRKAR